MNALKLTLLAALLALDVGPSCGRKHNNNDCASYGGECVSVSNCAPGERFATNGTCGGASIMCCVKTCGGAVENFDCCSDTGPGQRPVCEHDALVCPSGYHMCNGPKD